MGWCWPLIAHTKPIPTGKAPGAFGARRKFDRHTGVDLYCPEFTYVRAVTSGRVVAHEIFTGPHAGSPWWHETHALVIRGARRSVLYGELSFIRVSVGDWVEQGQTLGQVARVLRKDKGLPTSMLHIELYENNTPTGVWWKKGQRRPKGLLDPTKFLKVSPRPYVIS